jgi:sulfate permease, SulP family
VGSLFFASVGKMEYFLDPKRQAQPFVILEASQMLNLDTTGLETLESLHRRLVHQHSQLILSGLQEQPRSLLHRSGFADRLGEKNIVTNLAEALTRTLADGPGSTEEANEKTGQP